MTRLDKVLTLVKLSEIQTEAEKRNMIIVNACPDLWLDVGRCLNWRINKDMRKCNACWKREYLGEEVKA